MAYLQGHEKRFKLFHTLITKEDQFGYSKWVNEIFPDNIIFKRLPKDILYIIIENLVKDKMSLISFAATCSFICGHVEFMRFKNMHEYKRVTRLIMKNGSKKIAEFIIQKIMNSDVIDIEKICDVFNMAITYGYEDVIKVILDSKKFRSESVYEMEFNKNTDVNYLDLSSSSEYTEIIVESKKFVPSKSYVKECLYRCIRYKQYNVLKLLLSYPYFDVSLSDNFWENLTEQHEVYWFNLESLKDALDNNKDNVCKEFNKWQESAKKLIY